MNLAPTRVVRPVAAGCVMLLTGLTVVAPPASAVTPPDIDAIAVVSPTDSEPSSPVPMKQKTKCAVSASFAKSDFDKSAPANTAFEVPTLHEFSTGKGVTVAVVDSGVQPNDRLPRLKGGGDYITSSDGLEDCDHHGTLIAGIIGAQPSPDDGFIGVAPDSSLISIRQTSAAYEPANRDDDASASSVSTLARAIVHAAELGAEVINLSVTACLGADDTIDDTLAKALRWAVQDKDVVVVASAGNATNEACEQNPGFDPADPGDLRNWSGVKSVSMPSYYSPLVISVGGALLTGERYPGTLQGPWVDVAAPAEKVVSLDPADKSGGLINAQASREGPQQIAGTSFAAAYVSGLAALIRSRWPNLTAKQVRERIINTAATPSLELQAAFGAGLVDPVAALTDPGSPPAREDSPRSKAMPAPDPVRDDTWLKALISFGVLTLAVLIAAAAVARRRLQERKDDNAILNQEKTR